MRAVVFVTAALVLGSTARVCAGSGAAGLATISFVYDRPPVHGATYVAHAWVRRDVASALPKVVASGRTVRS